MIWAVAACAVWALGWWLNVRLANGADISGGHIRTIVSTAHVIAASDDRAIAFDDIRRALMLHYKAIGRTPPSGLEGQA